MDAYEFGEIEQRDEVTERQIHRPPDLPFTAVAHEAASDLLPLSDGSRMLYGASTGIDARYIPQQTSMAPFQFNQQLPPAIEHMQAHESVLVEDMQQQWAEEELRHTVACWEIRNQARTLPAIFNSTETVASDSDAATGESATSFTGVYNAPGVPAYPSQIHNHGLISNESSSIYGFDAGLWSAQQLQQVIVSPEFSHPNAQGLGQQNNAFVNDQNLDYNSSGQSTYAQQPPIDPIAFATSNHDAMTSVMSPAGQGSYLSSFLAPIQPPWSQQNLQLRNHEAFLGTSSHLLTNTTIDAVHGATDFPPNLLWNETAGSPTHSPFAETMHNLPADSRTDRLDRSIIDMTDDPALSMPTGAIRRQPRCDISRRNILVSPYDTSTRSGREMEKIEIYEGPAAGHPSRGAHSRTYSKRGKRNNPRACFGCRLKQKGCEMSNDGICVRCHDTLKAYSYQKAGWKFTCNVRTKFSDMSIYTDTLSADMSYMDALCDVLSSLSIEWRIEPSKSSRHLTEGYVIKLPLNIVIERPEHADHLVLLKLLSLCQDFLDILEPLHPRRMFSSAFELSLLWSYSFSLVKWKSAICLFWPSLKRTLEFHERYHWRMHASKLKRLDKPLSSGNYFDAAVLLNAWYEGVSAMEDTPLVDNSAKDHLLSSLTHHLLHVYRVLLPKTSDRSQRKIYEERAALTCNLFSRTLDLLPANWRLLRRGHLMRTILRTCSKPSISQDTVEVRPGIASSLDSRQQSEFPAPLKAYFPSGFLDLFGRNIKKQQALEAYMQGIISSHPPSLQEELLGLSPCIIGVGLRVFLSLSGGKDTPEQPKFDILYGIIMGSQYVWTKAIDAIHRSRGRNRLTISDLTAEQDIVEGWMEEWTQSYIHNGI